VIGVELRGLVGVGTVARRVGARRERLMSFHGLSLRRGDSGFGEAFQ